VARGATGRRLGFIRGHEALAVLVRNKWLDVEQTVGELRIRLGQRARTPSSADVGLRF
jgi:hypothetical protein